VGDALCGDGALRQWRLAVRLGRFLLAALRRLATRSINGPKEALGEGREDLAEAGSGFVFPVRMGRDTIELTPDQLSMFMLPEARRAAILIGAIDPGTQITVTSHSPEVGQWPMRLLSADVFSNSLSLEHGEGSTVLVTVPLDHVDTVWKDSRGWCLHLRGRLYGDNGRIRYDVREQSPVRRP
jgi:hypothetical protein